MRLAGRPPIKPRLTRKGYQIVDVAADGRPSRSVEVHCLIADAFLGPRPPGLTIDHADDDKSDNRPHRLEYVTNLENQRRRWARRRAAAERLAAAPQWRPGEVRGRALIFAAGLLAVVVIIGSRGTGAGEPRSLRPSAGFTPAPPTPLARRQSVDATGTASRDLAGFAAHGGRQ